MIKLQTQDARDLVPSDFHELSQEEQTCLALQAVVFHSLDSFKEAPYLQRLAVRGRKRIPNALYANGFHDNWGAPNDEGLFIDCNTSNKSAGKSRRILGPLYNESKNLNGLVQVHLWPHTTKDPLLFTFVPNLAYLPAPMAPLTDAGFAREPHLLMSVLQLLSIHRFKKQDTFTGIVDVKSSWNSLPQPTNPLAIQFLDKFSFEVHQFEGSVYSLVKRRSEKFLACFDYGKRVTSRYHNGTGRIDRTYLAINKRFCAERIAELRAIVEGTFPRLS